MRRIVLLFLFSWFFNPAHADVWQLITDDKLFENPQQNMVSLIFYRAPSKIVWTSPGAMVRSAIWNEISGDPSPIAHVDALIACEGIPSELTGMSRVKSWAQNFSILTGQQSLELLIESFPGRLIPAADIRKEVQVRAEKDRVRTLTFKVSQPTCLRALSYVKEYRKRDYSKIYAGFKANPFKGEGAGCAAFAMSVLQVAGLLDAELSAQWTRKLNLPRSLMNIGVHKAKKSFWDFMLFKFDGEWGKRTEDSVVITVFDPELMYEWVGTVKPEKWDSKARLVKSGKSLGIQADRSHERPPTSDFWAYSFPPTL